MSVVSNSLWPLECSMPGFPDHHQLPEFAQTRVHRVSDAIQPSHLLLSPFPPTFNLSQHHSLFQWVSASHQVAKYWSFSISPSNEYSGLISFRIDCFDLFAFQGALKSLLRHHSTINWTVVTEIDVSKQCKARTISMDIWGFFGCVAC